MQLAGGKEHIADQLQDFITKFEVLDQQREGLDFEISDMMLQLDIEAQYRKVKQDAKLEDLPQDSQIG